VKRKQEDEQMQALYEKNAIVVKLYVSYFMQLYLDADTCSARLPKNEFRPDRAKEVKRNSQQLKSKKSKEINVCSYHTFSFLTIFSTLVHAVFFSPRI
jgi:hypothetical protein